MAAPATPANFYVQQGNGQVFLAWDISAGATSYSVLRSTDNVTFSSLGTAATNSYLDSTVTTGTQYFYQVKAVNASGSSPATNSAGIIPVSAGKASLAELRLQSQQTADMVNSQFLSVPEWNSFINLAADELYDLLVTSYEDYNVASPYTFTADGTTQQYTLPSDFYKLLGVDMAMGAAGNGYVTLQKFDFARRNDYTYPQLTTGYLGVFNCRYRLVGNTLFLIPVPAGAQSLRVWYIPRRTRLLQDTDQLDGVSGWTRYVVVRAAKYALDKEESSTAHLDAELLYLKQRIEESATNRDAGMPDTITRTRNGGYGDDFGSGGPIGGF